MSETNQRWECLACGFLLGWVEHKSVLRVKRKDLYIEITKAQKIVINCCRCGKPNELKDIPEAVVPLRES